jgi:transposase
MDIFVLYLKNNSKNKTMFIRTKTTPNSPRKSVQIVENQRDSKTGKVKQKILRYVGIAMDDIEEGKLKQLALEIIAKMQVEQEANSPQLNMLTALSKEERLESLQLKNKLGRPHKKNIEDILPTSEVTLDMIVEESRVIDGVHEIAGSVYDDQGYLNILYNKKYNKILKDLVLCRISNPTSKLATSHLLGRYYMKEHDLDSIYRTMDHVFDRIGEIQSTTFMSTARLIPGKVDVVLFDVSTLHFESTEVDELRNFGYSKNFRFNTTQVVLALATTPDGLPIGYELFEGNKAEVKTLIEAIDGWKKRFTIGEVCFIGDRAMFSEGNLKELESKQYTYIVAAKLRSLPELMQQKIMDQSNYDGTAIENKFVWVGEFSYQQDDIKTLEGLAKKPQTIRRYRELIEENKERRFVVSYSSARAFADKKHRDILLAKIEKQLDRTSNSAKLISSSALKKYTSNKGKSDNYLDQDKIAADAMWDGFHGIITNIKPAKGEPTKEETADIETQNKTQNKNANQEGEKKDLGYILSQYRRLVKIEDCFRVNKTTLKMRPIYHFKPERIRAHIAICYMAFAVVRQLEYRVKLVKKLSIASIIEELNTVQSSIYVHKVTGDRYRVPSSFSNEARKIYAAINLTRCIDAHPIV